LKFVSKPLLEIVMTKLWSFGGVAPASEAASWSIQLDAARGSTAFFPRLARCATNVLDLFHLPHDPPTDPGPNLLRYVESGRQPPPSEIEQIASKKEITGRRFSAAPLLAGVGSEIRQCLIDIFGGTVIDARNAKYDPDRFPASA